MVNCVLIVLCTDHRFIPAFFMLKSLNFFFSSLNKALPCPNLQLANQKLWELSWYPAISSHWPDITTNQVHLVELGCGKYLIVRFSGISSLFGLAMGILARLRLFFEPWLDLANLPDMPLKRTKKKRYD